MQNGLQLVILQAVRGTKRIEETDNERGRQSPPTRKRKPPVWIALAVGVVAPVATLYLAGPVFDLSASYRSEFPNEAAFAAFRFVVCLIPLQLTLVAFALLGGMLSGGGIRQRLGLVCPRIRGWVVLLAAIGGLFPLYVGFWIRKLLFAEPTDQLQWWPELLTEVPQEWIGFVILAVAILPAVCEEALYRGCVLRSLVRRWHPLLAVIISGAMFIAIHMDLQHMIAIAPMGFWLSYVGWRSDSLLPCTAGHFTWNLVASILCRLRLATLDELHPALHWLVLFLVLPTFLAALFQLKRARR